MILRNIGKFTIYALISCSISFLTFWSKSNFISNFSNTIIPLLSTILTINITTSALLSSEIKKFILNTPNSETHFKDTITEIKWTFKIQIILISSLFIILIIKDIPFLTSTEELKKWNQIITDAYVIGVFIYFLEIIYDLGIALFQILEHNKNNPPNSY